MLIVENRTRLTRFIKVVLIVSATLVMLSLNPRIQRLKFEFQIGNFHINTETQYEIQKGKAIEVLNVQ